MPASMSEGGPVASELRECGHFRTRVAFAVNTPTPDCETPSGARGTNTGTRIAVAGGADRYAGTWRVVGDL